MTNSEAVVFWRGEAEKHEAAFLVEVAKLGTPEGDHERANRVRRLGKDARAAERSYQALIDGGAEGSGQ